MASRRCQRRRACLGKIRYDSAVAAWVAATATARSNHRRGEGGQINAYRCPFCGGYHCGHARRH